jgi:hypothetical protein
MREIHTAQYRYSGEDRFDITVKGNHEFCRLFAPTWKMVMDFKNKKITKEDYTKLYIPMAERSIKNARLMEKLGERFLNKIVLVCFCRSDSFCHRFILSKLFEDTNFGKYMGEVKI